VSARPPSTTEAGPAADHEEAGHAALRRLATLPGGRELITVAGEHPGCVALVGGAVRDLLGGRSPRELDAVVSGELEPVATALSGRLGAEMTRHERFDTATVTGAGARVDLARARTESYPTAGALPVVGPASLEQDLGRRDFTVNAIALKLEGAHSGELIVPGRALDDLRAGRLRVLHDASFRDDPTRVLRLARYEARLGFTPEAHTARLAEEAIRGEALTTVSGARLGAELRLALREPDPVAVLGVLHRLGALAALHPRLLLDAERLRAALELLPADGRPDLLVLCALSLALSLSRPDPGAELRGWLDRLEFGAGDRERVLAAALATPRLREELPEVRRPSELRAVVDHAPLEAVALAGALGARDPAQRWLSQLRHVRLTLRGDDLLAAGIPPGPEIGRRLASTLDLRLDGALAPGREAELAAALRV